MTLEPTAEPGSGGEDLEQLLYRALEAAEAGDRAGVEALRSAHPEHAEAIARHLARIGALGFAAPDDAARPERIGAYRVLDVLGEGGMGTVYLAEQRDPVRRRVALKVIKLGMDSKQILSRFEAERQALAMMNHDHIAKVFDAGTTARGQPYFAMEHVPGLPITEHCDTHKLTIGERLALFRKVCAGVQHAHQKGVIHRDLKPSNVLVTLEQGNAVPKIIDFGLARATDHRLIEATLFTQHGVVVGTPEYMSPEQAEGGVQDIDTRTDVYSLGVLLYELLVGALPFGSRALREAGLLEIQRKIREDDPLKPSSKLSSLGDGSENAAMQRGTDRGRLARALRGDLDWIVMRAMEKDRSRRYDTAVALAEDVGRHLAHEPVIASPPSASYRLRKLVRRYRGQVAAGGVVFLALVASIVSFAIQNADARANARRAVASEAVADRRAVELDRAASLLEARKEEFDQLATVVDLRTVREREKSLYPAWPERAPAVRHWLEQDWAPLQRALPELRRTVTALRRRTNAGAGDERIDADRFLHGALNQVVQDLEAFAAGEVAAVRERLAWAERVERLSIDDFADRWQEAGAAIRDADNIVASERYRAVAIDLSPQIGLVPIGMNPTTKLWEFYHLRSAADPSRIPQHDADGSITVGEESGMVFVLIPGGSFLMGAQRTDPSGANFDPEAKDDESPVHSVTLSPYFLARHELTQAQWQRLAGTESPSHHRGVAGPTGQMVAVTTHPVEAVDWHDAARLLRHHGLLLPTSAQWEYACRAATTTPWFRGTQATTLHGVANLLDERTAAQVPAWGKSEAPDDGFRMHAPVGSFPANPWGLFDMDGNVSEWCLDGVPVNGGYQVAVRPGDGFRQQPDGRGTHPVTRGGNFTTVAGWARSAAWGVTATGPSCGLRAARPIGSSSAR